MKVLNFPIKFPQNFFGRPLTDLVNNGFDNGIILFRKTDPEMVADYSFYEESEKIIDQVLKNINQKIRREYILENMSTDL